MTLPTREQFLTANYHLSRAAESAHLVHWLEDDWHKTECLKDFRKAAEELGLELVEIIPQTDAGAGRMG